VIGLILTVVCQTQNPPYVALSDGKKVEIRSFDVGTSGELDRLKKSSANLIIIRFSTWGPAPDQTAKALQNGPNGRRVVLVDFPALGANPNNGLLWRGDWDPNGDGKPNEDAPTWLGPRNSAGFYPIDASSQTLRNRLLGPSGLVAVVARAGFDGILISPVDGPNRRLGADAKLAADLMFEGRKRRSGFVVFMRNPGKMMDFPAIRHYFDGYLADGLFFGSSESNKPSDKAFVADSLKRLEGVPKKRRIVLSLAYTTDPDQIAENKRLALEKRFIPLARPDRFEAEEAR
jgi:hypothetical protein